jgi:hypothetical protein
VIFKPFVQNFLSIPFLPSIYYLPDCLYEKLSGHYTNTKTLSFEAIITVMCAAQDCILCTSSSAIFYHGSTENVELTLYIDSPNICEFLLVASFLACPNYDHFLLSYPHLEVVDIDPILLYLQLFHRPKNAHFIGLQEIRSVRLLQGLTYVDMDDGSRKT